jgi:uncharacterized protein YneF (UPF0154 family)
MNKTIATLGIILGLVIGFLGGYFQGKVETKTDLGNTNNILETRVKALEINVNDIINFLKQATAQQAIPAPETK